MEQEKKNPSDRAWQTLRKNRSCSPGQRQESGRFRPGSPEGPPSREELQPSLRSEPVAKAQSGAERRRAAEQPTRRGQRNPAKGLAALRGLPAKPIYRRPRQGGRFGRLGQELSPPIILHANLSG